MNNYSWYVFLKKLFKKNLYKKNFKNLLNDFYTSCTLNFLYINSK